jgi:hypothetical protein
MRVTRMHVYMHACVGEATHAKPPKEVTHAKPPQEATHVKPPNPKPESRFGVA